MTCGTYMNRRKQRIILDRFHIVYTRKIMMTVIEITVGGNLETGGTVTHNQQH